MTENRESGNLFQSVYFNVDLGSSWKGDHVHADLCPVYTYLLTTHGFYLPIFFMIRATGCKQSSFMDISAADNLTF